MPLLRISPRLVASLRGTAHFWTILVTLFAVIDGLTASPALGPVPLGDWTAFLVLYGPMLGGLWIAWRWELVGGVIAMASLPFYAVAFRVIHGVWPLTLENMRDWGWFLALPGVLFVVCWYAARQLQSPDQGGAGAAPSSDQSGDQGQPGDADPQAQQRDRDAGL